MKHITLFCLTLFFSINALAQSVSGTVTSRWEGNLNGANIKILGTNKGVASVDGKFQLEVQENEILEISYVGYNTQKLVVGDDKQINIELTTDELDEVLLIGQGIKKECRTICCHWSIATVEDNATLEQKTFQRVGAETSIKLFPNPAPNGVFNINAIEGVNISEIKVSNMAGQVVKYQSYSKSENIVSVDLSSFASGVYLIQVLSNGIHIETKRALKL